MAALFDRSSVLEELELDASDAPGEVCARFVRKIVQQAMLPRKILIESATARFEIFANRGQIVGYRDPDSLKYAWITHPVSNSDQKILTTLEISAGDALRDGLVSLSLLDDQERIELREHATPAVTAAHSDNQQSSEVVSMQDWKQDKSAKAPSSAKVSKPTKAPSSAKVSKTASLNSPVVKNFYDSIKDKALFVCYTDGSSGQVSTSGSSGAISKSISQSVGPLLENWDNTTTSALSDGPKMILASSLSRADSALLLVIDGSQHLLAEIEMKNFGLVVTLWNKAGKTE